MLIFLTIVWVVSLAGILLSWPKGEGKDNLEKATIDAAWASFTPLHVFKKVFAIFIVIAAPVIGLWFLYEWIKGIVSPHEE